MTDTAPRWYFDFLSPFAYLHWQKVKALPADEAVQPVPIVLAAILGAHGQKGPAEIPGKRLFTYRHVLWIARNEGVTLRFPPAHPFNPIAALRLCIAAGSDARAVDTIFDWIWNRGQAGDSPAALADPAARLGIDVATIGSDANKAALRANTDAALAAGVYGVPTLAIGSELFWGNDAHGLAMAARRDPGLLADLQMQQLATLPVGAVRGG